MKIVNYLKVCLANAVLAAHPLAALAQDTTPPTLVSATTADGMRIALCFSEVMDATSAEEEIFYQVVDGAGSALISSVTLRGGGQSVIIDLGRPVSGAFTLQVILVTDLAGNEIAPGSSIVGRYWTALTITDIGEPQPPGSVLACSDDPFAVIAGGNNIGDAADQFTFLHESRTNSFDVRLRVDSLAFAGQATAKAGLVARESLEPDARMVAVYATPTNGANYVQGRMRRSPGTIAADFATQIGLDTFPIWLRLKRSGQVFSAYSSRDGSTWDPLGQAQSLPAFPAVALVGLGTVSRVDGVATLAEYGAYGETARYPNALISITQQPANATGEEHTRVTFSVSAAVAGAPEDALVYQWQAEASVSSGVFTNVYFADTASYTTPFLTTAENGQRFRAQIFVAGVPPLASDVVTLTVNPDVTGPRAVSATGTRSRKEIVLEFSEPLDPASAQIPAHYTVSGLTVTNATLDATGTRVTLALGAMQAFGGTNLVQISGVRDLAGHSIDPDPQSLSAPAYLIGHGFALQELYRSVSGNSISELRAAPGFPDAPHETSFITSLEGPRDYTENYGTRVTGFLLPRVTGSYNFFLCSDDQGEFWLSTDDDPAHLVRLCHEPQWMPYRDYTNFTSGGQVLRNASAPENRSSTLFPAGIPLVAGQMYYFEALSKEGLGGDHLSVAWQPPGAPLPANESPPISSEFLATPLPPGGKIQILEQPRDVRYVFDPPIGNTVYDETFASGEGGYTVADSGNPNPESPWTYDAGGGRWTVNGSANLNKPSWSALISPAIVVPRSGSLVLRFDHRHSFEYDGTRWDGGQVRLSVNGGAFQPVARSQFCAQGYTGVIQGNGILQGREGFNGDSPGYASGALITSDANLGSFNAGDTIQIQFIGAWDDIIQASLPNWLIDRVRVTEGECASQVAFSVASKGTLPGLDLQTVHHQWQRDCGAGFFNIAGATAPEFSFMPVPADLLCRFRCVISMPGISATTSVARITITPPQMAIRRESTNVVISWSGPGTLQVAQFAIGPWALASGVTNRAYTVRPSASQRFYRLRVP